MRNRPTGIFLMLAFGAGLFLPFMLRSVEARPDGAFRYRTVAKTPCYRTSPMQGRPPDAVVPIGTAIRLILPPQGMGSYTRVETKSGLKCWISNDAFRLMGK